MGCQSTPKETSSESIQSVAVVDPYWPRLTMGFVGDVIIHERLRTRQERSRKPYSEIWSELQNTVSTLNVAYANLEGPVAPKKSKPSGYPVFNFPVKIIQDLKDSGFDFVSTANNHSLDQGPKGLIETIQNLRAYRLGYTGTQTKSDSLGYNETWWYLYEINSSPVTKPKYMAFMACTEMTNGFPDHKKQVLHCYRDQPLIEQLVERLRVAGNVAATILLPHWGMEYDFKIDQQRKEWAENMIDRGALAVIGSHPHVTQKVTTYKSKNGSTGLIAYSLGNFISNQRHEESQFSIMLLSAAQYDPVTKKYVLEDYRSLPLWIERKEQKDGTSLFSLKKIYDSSKLTKAAQKVYKNHADDPTKVIRSDEEIQKLLLSTDQLK